MNKQELIGAMSLRTGLMRSDAAKAVDALVALVVEELERGGEVRIVGFGSFAMARRKASMGRDPRTGAPIEIPPTNHPRFRPGKLLKAIN